MPGPSPLLVGSRHTFDPLWKLVYPRNHADCQTRRPLSPRLHSQYEMLLYGTPGRWKNKTQTARWGRISEGGCRMDYSLMQHLHYGLRILMRINSNFPSSDQVVHAGGCNWKQTCLQKANQQPLNPSWGIGCRHKQTHCVTFMSEKVSSPGSRRSINISQDRLSSDGWTDTNRSVPGTMQHFLDTCWCPVRMEPYGWKG